MIRIIFWCPIVSYRPNIIICTLGPLCPIFCYTIMCWTLLPAHTHNVILVWFILTMVIYQIVVQVELALVLLVVYMNYSNKEWCHLTLVNSIVCFTCSRLCSLKTVLDTIFLNYLISPLFQKHDILSIVPLLVPGLKKCWSIFFCSTMATVSSPSTPPPSWSLPPPHCQVCIVLCAKITLFGVV